MECMEKPGAVVVPFRPRIRRQVAGHAGLTAAERSEALQWAEAARRHGVRCVQFHKAEAGDDPVVVPFMLIYRDDRIWAAWGVARWSHGFELWQPSTGFTVDVFPTLNEALAGILALA